MDASPPPYSSYLGDDEGEDQGESELDEDNAYLPESHGRGAGHQNYYVVIVSGQTDAKVYRQL